MRVQGETWPIIIVVISYVAAQDNFNTPIQNTPFNQYDVNIPRNDINNQFNPTTNNPYNPYAQQPQYGGNQYGQNDLYGQNNPYSPRPDWRDEFGYRRNPYEHTSVIKETTYFIVASRMVRPSQLYRVAVTVLKAKQHITIRASIQRNGVEVSSDHKNITVGVPETLLMRIPSTSAPGEYKLRVEGLYENTLGGAAFSNETELAFSQRSMTIFIQMDKPIYMQGEEVRFRTIPINTELRPFDDAVDVYMLDPNGHIMKRWLSRQSNLGTVSLAYQLSNQPVFGEWKVRIIAQNQIEESTFLVEEYYQTRFEVNVTMPAFFFTTDEYIHGTIMANYTSGAPVRGNLTLKASIRPIKQLQSPKFTRDRPFDLDQFNDHYRPYDPNHPYEVNPYEPYQRRDPNAPYDNNDRNYPYNNPQDPYHNPQDRNYQYSGLSGPYDRALEKYFNFDEEFPFWFKIPEHYYDPIPNLKFFQGVYHFKYPMNELLQVVPSLDGMEVRITATVGEHFLDEIIDGYSTARIYNSSLKLAFLGGSPQVFKPGMPISVYIVTSHHDGSELPKKKLQNGRLQISYHVEMRGGSGKDVPLRELPMSDTLGVWEFEVDVKTDLGLQGPRTFDEITEIASIKIQASFDDGYGERAVGELLLLAHHSPNNQHIKVSTSTLAPRVGEYIIMHIRSNYFVERFNYLIISKGIVLLTGDKDMMDNVYTMAVTLSAEMAPVATIVVWHTGKYGDVTADSLTFPVNGISRNKFSVLINNKKAKTGHKVEIAIYGEPGSYVGLSGVDRAFYTMQAGNELTYAKVLTKMASFDEQTNGTNKHTWISHEGNPDDLVYFPSSTFGIDANRTFEYVGLVVFSDTEVPRRLSFCNISQGWGECLNGECYRHSDKCNGVFDCRDGTDEAACNFDNGTDLALFRKYRFSRIQRQYDNVWLWKDVNIGPHGRYIFNLDVPARPAHWMVSAFSMSPSFGFGMLHQALEYVGVLPFFINVEMPTSCMQGEQVGARVSVFNYMTDPIEATVVLNGSPDYQFVHVEENGVVRAYNPRTSFGEHHFFIYIKAQDVAVVYIPIVPQRLGDIDVSIHAITLIGKDQVTKRLHVEADGLPQYRHQSVLLDLSNRAYAFQYMHVNVTETPILPYEYDRYYVFGSNKAHISVFGDVVTAIFPTMPMNATSMLNLPMDSAEQNMFSFAANMYTTLYMRYTQQRNRTLEREGFHHMNILYQRQLSFMQPDGSFSLFRSDWNQSHSSVWLTAYCARVFQEASFYEWENYIYIDPVVISKAVEWVLQHQTELGSFYETTWSPNRNYNASINWPNDNIQFRNISLTAHVLIMLETVKDLTSGLSSKVAIAQSKAIRWLERNLKLLEDLIDRDRRVEKDLESGKSIDYYEKQQRPFDIAIVAYALMKSKAPNAETAYSLLARCARIEGGLMYWGRERVPQPPSKIENQRPFLLPRLPYKFDSENIEATSYALLVYVARQEVFVDYIVRWLNTQRLTDYGWASTSDTAYALKALMEYTSAQRIRDISKLSVKVEATALPGKTQVMYVNENNRAQLQQIEIPNAWGTVKVQGEGTGYAVLQMHVQYNVDIAKFQTKPPVPAFDLWTRAEFYGKNHSHINYLSCQRWNNFNESERSGLTVLDITIPTGYIIQQQKLDAYILSRRVRNLQRARFFNRKVLFYFEYLDEQETCINLTVERWYPVANMSRYLPIRVYDYYAPERFNETIFDALTTYLLNICEVCGSSQCPYCHIYNLATTLPVPLFTLFVTTFVILIQRLLLHKYFLDKYKFLTSTEALTTDMHRKRKPLSQLTLDGLIQQKRKRSVDDNHNTSQDDIQKRAGTIVRIVMKNFMCHSHLEVSFKHNINYIIGRNGSGKSAIMTALVVGLGGKASITNRGNSIKGFIKAGKNSASVEVTLSNKGPITYRHEDYGNEITIVRNFTTAGSSSYKIKSSTGEVISTQTSEIHQICSNLNIQIDNPICLLNQDTSRNFLNTKDPHQKFLLFMRATRLEIIREEYKKMIANKKQAISKLKEKEVLHVELKNEMRILKKKLEDQKSIIPLQKKLGDLQQEAVWAEVRDAELEQNSQQNVVSKLREEQSVLEAEIENEALDYRGYGNSILELQQRVPELQHSVEEQNGPQTGLVRVLGELKETINQKQREKRIVVKDIALKTGNCKILEDEINKITTNFEQLEAEKAKRLDEMQEVEKKIKGVEGLLETSQNDLYQLRNAVSRLQDEERSLLGEIRQIDSQIANTNTRLNGFKENTNVMSLYGRDMPLLVEAIKKEKDKFVHMPRGPLGSYITLKNKTWAVAVEGFLSPALLRAFAVDNRNDNKLLMKIFEKVCRSGPKPMVITSKFFFNIHDVSSNLVRPVDGCISVFDAVEISDPVVTNCLIDQVNLESVLLIPDNPTAIKLMSNVHKVPRNCIQGITMNGDKYYPDPNYKTYASRYKNAQYLQVSMADMIQQLEQNLKNLSRQKETVSNQYESVKKDFLEQTQNAKASEIKVTKLDRALLHLKRNLSDLQNLDEPVVDNLTKMKDELRELTELIKQRNEALEKINVDVQELKRKIDLKEEKLEKLKVIVRGYEERIETLNAQIREKQGKLRNYEVNRRFATNRLLECKKRVKEADAFLNEKVKIVEKKTIIASRSGPRPGDLRDVRTIVKEFEENKRLLSQIESNMESAEVIKKKYHNCKEKNIQADEFMKNITEDIKLLQAVMEKCGGYYKRTECYFISITSSSFKHVLEYRQFQGSLQINMADQKVDLIVIPQHGSQGLTTTSNLSGGERSFSTVAFLYSLWQCIEVPFYFLDEFDVFMDKVNRNKVMEVLLLHAKKHSNLQFVFLTPQDVSTINDKEVAIHRLADPERGTAP
ncbi:hypothetical protein RN001_000596 [Aquatica leii]|uniref:Uncharacterized protein n=1 Tax=Aquatica leii TaxID=1421715 RepID=A0AAN7SSH1_9COLE|nr:hypothetical protein RN001_000596 [Aquatica leii]